MMTWTFVLVLIVAGLLKVIMTCLPTSVVESMIHRFEVHPTLNEAAVSVTFAGKSLEGEKKKQLIEHFNQALFLEKYYYPPSETSKAPFVIQTTTVKNNITFFLYSYDDHVDVIKKYKKKEISYRVKSSFLQDLPQLD